MHAILANEALSEEKPTSRLAWILPCAETEAEATHFSQAVIRAGDQWDRANFPTAKRALHPARMLTKSLNPGPELENGEGQRQTSAGEEHLGWLPAGCRRRPDVSAAICE